MLKPTDKDEVKACRETSSQRLTHVACAHITHYTLHAECTHTVQLELQRYKSPADGTALIDRSRAPDVMAELLLDIACQNKFTPLKGLGFPSL